MISRQLSIPAPASPASDCHRSPFFYSQFDYGDGFGGTSGRFAIDLYSADGSGDCGTFMYNLCDKPTIGCKDSSESPDFCLLAVVRSGVISRI